MKIPIKPCRSIRLERFCYGDTDAPKQAKSTVTGCMAGRLTCEGAKEMVQSQELRKLLAILLLVVFGLPLVSPLFAQGAGASAGLPFCCRRDGLHQCMGNMVAVSDAGTGAHVGAPRPVCPFYPRVAASGHLSVACPGMSCSIFAELVSHPCGVAQVRSRWRIARERSRGKRGPPAAAFA